MLKGGISDTKEERENGSGHKYKHAKNAKYKNAKEKETKNGLDQNRANTIVQKYNIETTQTQRMERKDKLAQLQTLPVTLCSVL